MQCENINCNKEHDGSYGSGRFCSSYCARSFSTSKDTKSTKICECIECGNDVEVDKRASPKTARCKDCKPPKWTDEDRQKAKNAINQKIIDSGIAKSKETLIKVFGVDYKCKICGISEWLDSKISLELDHIDGNRLNNSVDNLRLLCPNCHSQTDTFRGRNIPKQRLFSKQVSDNDLLDAINSTTSIRQALIKVGLTPKGGNYKRVYEIQADMLL